MKIVFVAIGVENIATEFLSSFLKKHGHKVELVFDPRLFASEVIQINKLAKFFDTKKEIVKQVLDKKPDLIGFSVFTFSYQRALELAREIKKHNKKIPIIFGGIHPTSVPKVVIKQPEVDIVCIGEGESALLELLESLKQRKLRTNIQNLWFKKGKKIIRNSCRPLIDNLDDLPFPDKELFYNIYPGLKNDYYALTSRGCPFACTYCANSVWQKIYRGLGKPVRRRSPKNVIAELVLAKEKFSPQKIAFVDDVFCQDLAWLKEFSQEYKRKIGLPYSIITHPRFLTPKITKLLAGSGCYFLIFGVQSVSEEIRRKVLNRFETNKEISQAAKNCHQAGLPFSIGHIFNIPGEGVKEYEQALHFYNQLRPSVINSYWLQYFPKTEIIKTAIKKGIMSKAMVKKIEKGLTSASIVVGFGGKDNFNRGSTYTNFELFFTLLPLLPKRIIQKLIQWKIYNISSKLPIIINISFKALFGLMDKRRGVYLEIIKSIIYFMKFNLALKWQYRKKKL